MENEIYLISQSCPPRRCQVIPSPQRCRVTLPRKDLILCTRRNPEIVLDIATYVIDKGQSVYAQRYCTNDLHGALNDVVLCGFDSSSEIRFLLGYEVQANDAMGLNSETIFQCSQRWTPPSERKWTLFRMGIWYSDISDILLLFILSWKKGKTIPVVDPLDPSCSEINIRIFLNLTH